MESSRRLALAALSTLVLLSPLAAAEADAPAADPLPWSPVSAGAGVCVSRGDLPGTPPSVQYKDCGPRVILRLVTPEGTREMDVGMCSQDCEALLVLVVEVCPGDADRPFHSPAFAELARSREVEEALLRGLDHVSGPGVYEAQVGDGCEP